jgi:hypothetical protein
VLFRSPAPFGLADSVYLFDSGAEPIPTTIITTQVNGISYEQILQSQNGAVYQVNGLTINVVSALNDGAKASQLLKPFIFKKREVNGNKLRLEKFQTIDPYQYQFSYGFVNLVDENEVFVLDGNTEFRYEIEPNVAVNVTFNYIELKNENFGSEESDLELAKNIDEDLKYQEDAESATTKEMVIKDNAVTNSKPITNKQNILWYLIGGTAVYLLFNFLKSNQK